MIVISVWWTRHISGHETHQTWISKFIWSLRKPKHQYHQTLASNATIYLYWQYSVCTHLYNQTWWEFYWVSHSVASSWQTWRWYLGVNKAEKLLTQQLLCRRSPEGLTNFSKLNFEWRCWKQYFELPVQVISRASGASGSCLWLKRAPFMSESPSC